MSNFDINSNTLKTLSELFAQWDETAIKIYSNSGYIECFFLIRNPYNKPGRLYSLQYSLDGGITKQIATISHTQGAGSFPFNLNAKNKKISVWWFAAYDLRLMMNFENVKLYAKFCEDITGDQSEEIEYTMDVDLRPTGILKSVHPQSNDRYFNVRFVSQLTITPGSLHFTVEVDTVNTFDSQNKITLSTMENPGDWTADGAAFPSEGVVSDQSHVITYTGLELSSLGQDTYYYRVSSVIDQFYPVITSPGEGHSFSGATVNVTGHVEVVDDVRESFVIHCGAGRFNFSWDNDDARIWEFPAGTVIYGTSTPISYSTNQQPDVEIPAGGGDVVLKCRDFRGRFELNDNDTDTVFVGALSDLPELTHFIRLQNCSNITGDLSDLPRVRYYLNLYGCGNVTGDLSDLPPVTYMLSLYNIQNIIGDLKDLPAVSHYLSLVNNPVSGVYSAVYGEMVPTYSYFDYTNMSSSDMDNTLIAYAATTKNNGTLRANGITRTAASDDAISTLVARGWSITGITKV